MKLYISGPMTGYADHNKALFDEAAAYLRSHGHEVVSPAELDQGEGIDVDGDGWTVPDEQYEQFMERDLATLESCEAIVFLPGWQRSGGAGREGVRAIELRLKLYVLDRNPYELPNGASAWWPLLRIDTQFFLENSTTERLTPSAR